MRKTAILLSICASSAVTGTAPASELAPIQARSIKLDHVVGTAYYTVEQEGYRVVATVAPGEEATPVRFVATLLSGQKAIVSVPRGLGQASREIEIRRIDDRVFVSEGSVLSRLSQ